MKKPKVKVGSGPRVEILLFAVTLLLYPGETVRHRADTDEADENRLGRQVF